MIQSKDALAKYDGQIEKRLKNPVTKLTIRMLFSVKQFLEHEDELHIINKSYDEIIAHFEAKETHANSEKASAEAAQEDTDQTPEG